MTDRGVTLVLAAKDAAVLMDIIETAVKAANDPQEGKDAINGRDHTHG